MPTEQIPAAPLLPNEQTFGPSGETNLTPSTIEANFSDPMYVPASLLLWLLSISSILILPAMVALPYILFRYRGVSNVAQSLSTDPTVLLLTVIGVIPAHILTFVAAWAVVTRWRRRPFWRTIGWSFGPAWGLWPSVGLAIALYFVGAILAKLIGGEPTDIDILVNSSTAVRLLLALVATTSGPLVEEIVYRGILYPSLQKRIGMAWSVVLVSFLFAFIHVYQYRNSLGVITVIFVLSISLTLVRALTGRLLPCFIVHMVFNGIQSVMIVMQPYFEHFKPVTQPKTSMYMLWQLAQLFKFTHGL
jgi:membrane protease YdiL (CAAX protease family)